MACGAKTRANNISEKEGRWTELKRKTVNTIVAFILDKSGSMSSCRDAAISGFNEYLQTSKASNKKGECTFNLTLFNNAIERRIENMDVLEVPELTTATYKPDGMTALYDAAVITIERIYEQIQGKKKKPAVLVAIMTDGEENSSRQYDEHCLQDLIAKLQKEGNWTFVFMGANQDSYAKASKMGISAGNTMNWSADEDGTRAVFAAMATSSLQYKDTMLRSANQGKSLNTANYFIQGGDQNVAQS